MSVVLHTSEWADSEVCLALPEMMDVSAISHEAAVWFWQEYTFSLLSQYLGIGLWVMYWNTAGWFTPAQLAFLNSSGPPAWEWC